MASSSGNRSLQCKDLPDMEVNNMIDVQSGEESLTVEQPNMSDLRIILLGKSVTENCRVGNFIVGRAAFESQTPADDEEEQHSEKHRGKLKDRDVTVINTPHLLQPNLTNSQSSQRVRECVSLSAPGPHVIILVLQKSDFSDSDRHRVKHVLNEFSEEALKHTIVFTDEREIQNDCVHQFIEECGGGHLQFDERKSGLDSEILERVEKMLKENQVQFLMYGLYEEPGEETSEDEVMASSSGPALNEELQCSICLEVFTDPVTTPCGHNFCRTCLSKRWKTSTGCFCPLCKETFSRRPDLKINTTLGKLVHHFEKKLNLEESEVFCDFCSERKQKAVKTCLTCQSSYCDDHLEPHLRVPRLKKHKLINAVENLEDYICQKHERPLEMFCRDDQMCVCLSCSEGEHKTHNTVPIEEESREKKTQKDEQQMIQRRMKKIQQIRRSEQRKTLASNDCFLTSSRTVHISNGMIIGLGVLLVAVLITLSKQYTSEQLKMMEEQQKAAEKQAEDLIKLKQEITELEKRNTELEKRNTELQMRKTNLEKRNIELRNRNTELEKRNNELENTKTELKKRNTDLEKRNTELEKRNIELEKRNTELEKMEEQAEDLIKLKQEVTELEKLSHSDDHLRVKQMYSFLSSLSKWTETDSVSDVDVNALKRALTELKELLHEKLNQTGLKFAQNYAVDLTLDPDTANPYFILSDDGKQVSHGDIKQDVPENPKRFDGILCVLANQGFSSGRFYYEVQVKGKTGWILGVTRESINRKENFDTIPTPEDGVWVFYRVNENMYAVSDDPMVFFRQGLKPEKVGVFVDYEEGLVSFYDVDSRSHIYSFTGQTFTEKLFPYFSPYLNDEGKNSNPLIITPVS